MQQKEIQQRFDAAKPRVGIFDSKDQEAVEEVLKHKGFWLIYELMLGSRQAYYSSLSHAPIGNMSEVHRAAVIQGTIQGIELFAQTVVEQGVSSPESESKEQR